MTLSKKHEAAVRAIRDAIPTGRLAVAFSGGVDSTLLLALAKEALGSERVLAVTARSASLAEAELEACHSLARELGVDLELLETRELERPDYRANSGDRCFHCKDELFLGIEAIATTRGVEAVAYGATADDVGDHRPGMRAAGEHQVLAPLLDAGFTKPDVRDLSLELGLPTWDKPAQPCLASRVPYGEQVTATKLRRIELAEKALKGLGLRELRVRHHGADDAPTARIEVPVSDLQRIIQPDIRQEIASQLRAIGFSYVTLDLEGFRSGRLNDALSESKRRLPVANV
jgi:uncharacterized protein